MSWAGSWGKILGVAPPAKSQWDFGELFPPEQFRKVLSVSELTGQMRRVLEKQFQQIWVTGEVTNLRAQSSGHYYFTLKDAVAQLSCVLFRGESGVDRSLLQDGRKVLVRGDVTVYEPRGQYQLRVTELELQGVGALQVAFEKLKQKLSAEGLFAQERKRALPTYAQRIGLVTSPTGAAIRDVLHVVERRNPALEIVLAPSRVQGDGAAREIAEAIRLLNEFHRANEAKGGGLDLILVTRGGGSLEDLWAFNEEVVARAVFESSLPVVSAVGHEIDFTISDFVADLRAATPSAAAELITEGVFSSWQFVRESGARLTALACGQLEEKRDLLVLAAQRLERLHPRRKLNEHLQRLDDLVGVMARRSRQGLRLKSVSWQNLAGRLGRMRPAVVLNQRRELLSLSVQRLREQARHRLSELENQLRALRDRLRLLGPEQVLARGYSITTDLKTGRVLRDSSQVKAGSTIQTRVQRGRIVSRVED